MVKTTMIITTLRIKIIIMFVTKEECLVHVDVFMGARLHNWYQTLELLPVHLEIITMSILSWLQKKHNRHQHQYPHDDHDHTNLSASLMKMSLPSSALVVTSTTGFFDNIRLFRIRTVVSTWSGWGWGWRWLWFVEVKMADWKGKYLEGNWADLFHFCQNLHNICVKTRRMMQPNGFVFLTCFLRLLFGTMRILKINRWWWRWQQWGQWWGQQYYKIMMRRLTCFSRVLFGTMLTSKTQRKPSILHFPSGISRWSNSFSIPKKSFCWQRIYTVYYILYTVYIIQRVRKETSWCNNFAHYHSNSHRDQWLINNS